MLLYTDNRFSVAEPRAQNRDAAADPLVGFSKIPATQDLGLPVPQLHRGSMQGLRFDPHALVWVRKAKKRAVEREVMPPATVRPENRPGPLWEFLCRVSRVVIWRVTAADAADAEVEFARCCEAYGYRLTDGMMRRSGEG